MTQDAIGIDVGKLHLDVATPAGEPWRVANTPEGFAEIIARTAVWPDAVVGLEASGGYEAGLAQALAAAGRRVHLAEPARVRHFARAIGRRAKSDRIDCQVIAAYLAALPDEALRPPALESGPLRAWTDLRRRISQQLVRLANQRELVRDDEIAALLQDQEAQLRQQLAIAEARMTELAKADAERQARIRRLRQVPGVGEQTAIALVLFLPELGKLGHRQIAALAGVAPYDDQSGGHDGPRHIGGGRKHLRTALYMPVLTAVRCNPILRAFYQRLCQAGKPPKVALLACMRKLLAILNAMLRTGQDWNPAHAAAAP
jgi:transposase